ncbi:MAG: DNA-binding protein YbiB [Comamonas sp.]
MSISPYIKEIGRGKDGARPLTREQATDLLGQVLDGQVTDLEVGAFCLAMRIKGETPDEMAGFIDAARARMALIPPSPGRRPTVVLPSYNGARKLPVLTPLLARLLVGQGLRVVIHGVTVDPGRTTTAQVLEALGQPVLADVAEVRDDAVNFLPIEVLSPALRRLLDVRRTVGLRNSAHSLVKLINPCVERALVVGSYTHPEYRVSMAQTYAVLRADALLLRGIEGEAVADARRSQQIDAFIEGRRYRLQEAQTGPIASVPDWPRDIGAASIADYIVQVLRGQQPLPLPIRQQVQQIQRACDAIASGDAAGLGAVGDTLPPDEDPTVPAPPVTPPRAIAHENTP